MAVGSSADIGIRVFLDDAASQGLFAINSQLGRMGILARQAGLGFGGMSANMLGLGIIGGLAASFLLFGGAVVYSVDQAAKFQTLMIGLKAATGASDAQIQQMASTMLDLGAKSIFSLDEIAAGFTIAGQRGISAADIINHVAAAGINLAEAIGVKPVEAFGALASVMSTFNIPASQAAQVSDLLFFTFENGVPSIAQIIAGLVKIGSAADLLHLHLADVVPAFDILSRAFGSGTQAATALYYFLRQVSGGTKSFKDEIASLGLTFYDANGKFIGLNAALEKLYVLLRDKTPQQANEILQKLFNQKAGTGIGILIADLGRLHDLTLKLAQSHNAHNSAMDQAKRVEQSLAGETKALLTNLQDFSILVGGPIAAALQPVVGHINDFVSAMRHLASTSPQIFSSLMLFGAALAGIGLAVAIALSPFGLLIGIMLAVVLVIAGLAAGASWLAGNLARLENQVSPLGSAIRTMGQVLGFLGGIARDAGHFISAALGWALQQIGQDFKTAGPGLKMFGDLVTNYLVPALKMLAILIGATLVGVLHGLIAALAFVVAGVGGVFIGLATIIGGAFNVIKGIIMIFVGLVTGIFTGNWATWRAGWSTFLNGLLMICVGAFIAVKGVFVGTLGAIGAFIFGFIHGVISFFQNLSNTLVGHSIIPQMLASILSVFRSGLALVIGVIVNWISTAVGHFNDFKNRVLSFFANAGSWLVQAGKNIIQGLINGITSMIGAIGKAIHNVASFIAAHMPQSPAKIGPLRDINKWMPTMMQMMADSADRSMPTIRAMAGRIAGGIMPPMQAGGGRGGAGGVYTYNLVLDGRVIASWTVNYITGQMQQNGLGRAFR